MTNMTKALTTACIIAAASVTSSISIAQNGPKVALTCDAIAEQMPIIFRDNDVHPVRVFDVREASVMYSALDCDAKMETNRGHVWPIWIEVVEQDGELFVQYGFRWFW